MTQDVIFIDSSDLRVFVNDFITAMGYQYSSNVGISFPYVGIQVKAVSNLITKSDGSPFLIDFGDLYGDALLAIKKSGLDIIQVKREDDFHVVIKKILNTLGLPYSNNPDFLTADRPADYNITLKIPGFLIAMAGESKMLLSLVPLHNGVIQFLTRKGVKVVLVGSQESIT
jgi:hypothetical protein